MIEDASRIAAMEKLEEEPKEAGASKESEPVEEKDFGFVAVCSGDGLRDIFLDLGVDQVVSGGQSMNPSTEDLCAAVEKIHAKHVFILPNNKNILLAAQQVKDILEDRSVSVVPSKTIPQGISAMISFQPEGTVEENQEGMEDSLSMVSSGEITYAVRDTSIDGREIHKGDILFLGDQGLLSAEKSISLAMKEGLEKMGEGEILSLYYGEGVTEEEAKALEKEILEYMPNLEVEVHAGGQAVYYYLLSLE